MQTSQDRFDQLADRTLSVNPKAMRTCPWCLYELDGLLRDANAHPCPGCGEEVSGLINLTVWGKRTRWVPLYVFMTIGMGFAAAIWAYLAPFAIGFTADLFRDPTKSSDGPLVAPLLYSVPTLIVATPFVVFACCYRWMYLRNPTQGRGTRLLTSFGAAAVNLIAALLLTLPLIWMVGAFWW